ncbi:hypothetical protein BGZ76_006508 [Entomortierella beljakovae]|nr:hypothetical protein BGZ76_006508 [Entomortierella beljakovae]
MPFPTPSADLMASVMGGPLPSSTSSSSNNNNNTTPSTNKSKKDNPSESSTIRLFYSLKDNPNSIISYSDLIRQDQKRQQLRSVQSLSKSGGNNNTSGSSSAAPSVSHSPLKNSKATNKDVTSGTQSSTAMDIDPPEGEEALGEGDSEAEDDDEAVDDDEENEEDAEAEDEDDDDDPDEDEDDEDDPESGPREPRDFLDVLTERYTGIEEGNESGDEDEDEDEDGKGQIKKRPSRWDTEHYDIDDEFIDDSEMMLESIGMVRPKVDGFFAFRGPVETTAEDADSSDAGPRSKKTSKRKLASAASPLSTGKSSSKSNKGSSLAVMENANDSTSEMSEVEEKSKTSKPSTTTAGSGLVNSTTATTEPTISSNAAESTPSSVTATPTKKKSASSKSKSAGKEIAKDSSEANKDSDKESKATPSKKVKPKSAKASVTSTTTTTTTTTTATTPAAPATPIVKVDSPSPKSAIRAESLPPIDDIMEDVTAATPPPPPSRSASPSKPKSKSKPVSSAVTTATTANVNQEPKDTGTLKNKDASEAASTESESEPENAQRKKKRTTSDSQSESSKTKEVKSLEPLNDDVKKAYDVVATLAKNETWEVKSRFPPHIKEPLWECAKVALQTRSTGYVLEDGFFIHLQNVLPYNKYTLKKLVYKAVLPGWIEELERQRDRLISQFIVRTDMIWKSSGLIGKKAFERDVDGDEVRVYKFPWTQDLRMLLWETMEKFMEIHAARQELRAVDESQPAPPSDSKTRKDAYQTLLQGFPAGWMTSYEISRQYSQLKEKVQKMEKKEIDTKFKPNDKGLGVYKYGGLNAAVRIAPTAETMVENRHPLTLPPKLANSSSTLTAATARASTSVNVVVPATTTQNQPATSNEKDSARRTSPNKSPSTTQQPAPSSDTSASTTHVGQPRGPYHYYKDGAGDPNKNKKRKNPEEAPLGSGSSHDPMYIDDPSHDETRERNHRQNSGNSGGNSSSPSMSSSSQSTYKAPHGNDATKKKRAVDQRAQGKPAANPMPMGIQPLHQGQPNTQPPYYQDYKNDYPEYPDHPDYQRSREPFPQSFPPRQPHGYPPPPPSSSQRHYMESAQPHQSYLHRGPPQGGPPQGGPPQGGPPTNSYGGGQHPPSSRNMPSAPPHPGPNAMSMSNLLHHPHSSHTHHPRQGPM